MTNLSKDKALKAFKYEGFWKCMDTLRDKIELEKILTDKGQIWMK